MKLVEREEPAGPDMYIVLDFISGLMFGLEYLWDDQALVIDIGIVRLYIGKVPTDVDEE